ncbi:hypothetical protein, partial [Streptosporangium sp. NPDC002721]|uniref:hypothetical protein n=1 Tax=Streptosporangium sp. NPDC002721 TaxID=3366188 RepID=UPI00368A3370
LRYPQPLPAQRDDLSSTDPVGRSVPGTGQFAEGQMMEVLVGESRTQGAGLAGAGKDRPGQMTFPRVKIKR